MKIVYFVHDLNDAAVQRRVDMLILGGVSVTLLGFRRGDRLGALHGPVKIVDLGATQNGKMAARVAAVVTAALRRDQWQAALDGADIVLARNLECLALALPARRRRAPQARLAYECLDVHRLMLGGGVPGRVLRALEGWCLKSCDALMISSPAFIVHYFLPRHRELPPQLLVENRVLAGEQQALPPGSQQGGELAGPPWRIGWFGVIRCARSLQLLAALARAMPGQIEVVIRGRPARDVLPEFDAVVAQTPGMVFLGPYDRRTDLARLYGGVHFTWVMDFYETGGNSDWLLPNRLYEGSLYGAVALAFAGNETGRWFARHNAGIVMRAPLEASLIRVFHELNVEIYAEARRRMQAIPPTHLIYNMEECGRLVEMLNQPAASRSRPGRAAANGQQPAAVKPSQFDAGLV